MSLRADGLVLPDANAVFPGLALEDRLRVLLSRIQVELTALGGEALQSPATYVDMCLAWGERL